MVEEAVEERGGHGGVAGEDGGPLLESDVGGDDGGAAFVAFADDLEEEFAAALIEGEVAEFVEDEHAGGLVAFDFAGELVRGVGGVEAVDDIDGGCVEDGMALQAGGMPQGASEVGFAHPGGAEQDDVGASLEEAELEQVLDTTWMRLIFLGQDLFQPAMVLRTGKRASVNRRVTVRSWWAAGFTGGEGFQVSEVGGPGAGGLLGGGGGVRFHIAQAEGAQMGSEGGWKGA